MRAEEFLKRQNAREPWKSWPEPPDDMDKRLRLRRRSDGGWEIRVRSGAFSVFLYVRRRPLLLAYWGDKRRLSLSMPPWWIFDDGYRRLKDHE